MIDVVTPRVKVFTHFAKPGVWNAGKYYISYIHDHKLIRQNFKNNSIYFITSHLWTDDWRSHASLPRKPLCLTTIHLRTRLRSWIPVNWKENCQHNRNIGCTLRENILFVTICHYVSIFDLYKWCKLREKIESVLDSSKLSTYPSPKSNINTNLLLKTNCWIRGEVSA